jgi:zinc protease
MKNIFTIFGFACVSLACNLAQAQDSIVSVQLTVPDGGWKIRIDQVYQTPTHLLAVSKLERSPGLAIQVISQAKDSVKIKAPKLPVRHFVLGKTWNWPNKEPFTFLSNPKELSKPLQTPLAKTN